jgi:hypothetical protein
MTLYNGMDRNTLRLLRQFSALADEREEKVLLQVCGGVTGVWITEVLFDLSGAIYLARGSKRFCRVHQIRAMHFPVIEYDG